MSHADTIRAVYEAFGRGDVNAIIERLAPDVQWDCDRTPNDVPWLQPLRGRHEVPKFFAALTEHLDLRRFEPRVVLESGDTVLAMFDIEAIVRSTGKRLDEGQAAHIWHFDRSGRISSYKNAVDSFGASKALRAD
jgi:ketosteroid isomerase-like protein